VRQINTAMTQLNQTTQQNASASEELAATAEEMSGQAEQLQQLMGFFKVDMEGATGASRTKSAPSQRIVKLGAKAKPAAKPAALPGSIPGEPEFVHFEEKQAWAR